MVINDYHIHAMIFTPYLKVAYFKILYGENLILEIPFPKHHVLSCKNIQNNIVILW